MLVILFYFILNVLCSSHKLQAYVSMIDGSKPEHHHSLQAAPFHKWSKDVANTFHMIPVNKNEIDTYACWHCSLFQ